MSFSNIIQSEVDVHDGAANAGRYEEFFCEVVGFLIQFISYNILISFFLSIILPCLFILYRGSTGWWDYIRSGGESNPGPFEDFFFEVLDFLIQFISYNILISFFLAYFWMPILYVIYRGSTGWKDYIRAGGEANPGPTHSKILPAVVSKDFAVFYRHDNKYAKLDVMTHTINFVTKEEFKNSPWPCFKYKGVCLKYRGLERQTAIKIAHKYLTEILNSQGGVNDFITGIGAIINVVKAFGRIKKGYDATIIKICTSINAIVMAFLSLVEKVTPTSLLSFVSTIVATLTDFVSTHILKAQSYEPLLFSVASAYIPDTIMSVIKRMGLFTNTKICDETGILQDIVELIFSILEWMQEKVGGVLPECVRKRLQGITLWMSKRSLMMESKNVLKKYGSNPSIITNPFFCDEVKRVAEMWKKDSASLDWVIRSPFIKSIKDQVEGLLKAIIAQENITRQEPLMFVFEGPPGVMKSVVMNAVVEATRERAYSHTIKGLNDGKDFYDTYNNEDIFFMDDVGQQGISQWRNFINFVSCVNYKLDCADKDKKDTKFFTSSKIFVTTNSFQHLNGLTKSDGISDVTALWRRGYVFDFSRITRQEGTITGQVQFRYFNTTRNEFLNEFPSDLLGLDGEKPSIEPRFNVLKGHARIDLIAWILTIVKLFEEQRKTHFSDSRLSQEEMDAIANIVKDWSGLKAQGNDLDDSWLASIKDVIGTFVSWLTLEETALNVVWWVWLLATIGYYVCGGLVSLKNYFKKPELETLRAQYEEVIHPIMTELVSAPTNVQAIAKATYQCSFRSETVEHGSTCVVSGHFIIVPYHCVPKDVNHISIIDKVTQGVLLDNMPFTVEYENFYDDVMVLKLPRNIPSYFKNISHLWNICKWSKTRWLVTPVGVVKLDSTVGIRPSGFNYKDKYGTVRVVDNGFRYSFGTAGLCGSPLVDQVCGIIGMHVAGDPGGAARIFSLDTLNIIRNLLSNDSNVLNSTVTEVLENGVVLDLERTVFVNTKSSIKPTPLKQMLETDRSPANLKKYGRDTLRVVASKSFVKTGSLSPEELLFAEKVLDVLIPEFSAISDKEVVLGNEYLAKVNPDSSNGYNCTANKTDYIDYENGAFTPLLQAEIDKIYSQVKNNEFVVDDWLWTECLKDEVRNDEKNGVPRSFRIGRLPIQIIAKKLTGDLVAKVMKNKWFNGIMIGCNPFTDWQAMYSELAHCFGVFDGDVGKYDGGMLPQFQHLVAKMLVKKFIGSIEDRDVLGAISNNTVCALVVILSQIFCTTHSMPSGSFWTALFNSFINRMYTSVWYHRECLLSGKEPSIHEFFDLIVDFVYGDDKLVGIRKNTSMRLTAVSMCEFFRSIGLDFTDANKQPITYDYIGLHEMSFLKRTFVYHPKIGRIMCPLSKRTLMNSLAWYDSKKDLSVVMKDKFSAFQRELFLHTDEPYNELVLDMRNMLDLFGFDYTILPEEYLISLFKDEEGLKAVPWHSYGQAHYA